ncbi:DUF2530 domain-containing protein [Pseudonocardia asaccharolytica]|uniref:Membrane protein n=1 Tax=Pseudonocardia asaccharolytica DSM 44247 = NBRC 16224 TaxID=1123024 RepID=A0A511CZM3_9PSEU|nr:DUF2530 domain-containing protein [Pseudonocardia asaccharolytica]GEL17991.1 membrane protein [Pseudonocardia asaccharolytica DSM 44247 = NBRC 16224]
MVVPPPLPRWTSDITRIVAVGTLLWLAGAAILLVAHLVAGRPLDIWFTTCVAGVVLGGIGYGIFRWQRAAARRGARTAQDGLHES